MRNARLILPLVAIISIFFSSCSTKKENDCTLRFSWWGTAAREGYMLDGIARFESQHPTIKIVPESESWGKYEKSFGEKLLSGECADVMQVNFDWLDKYSKDGKSFFDLNELSDYIELYNFTLDDLSYGTFGGKLIAIPIAFNTAIPVFDRKVLAEHSLEIPSTWDELFQVAKVLKKKDMYVFTLSKRHLFFVAMAWFEQTHSKRMFLENETLNMTDEEIGQTFDFVRRLAQEHVIYSMNEGFSLNAMRMKKVAGAVLWCNETSLFISEAEKLGGTPVLGNFITTPGATESGWYLKPASMYAIKKDCRHPKEAALLVNYLLNSEDFALLQQNEKGVPTSNKSLLALMESGKLESMQYNALMKIRFNNDSINPMLPIMEDNSVILSFADSAFDCIKGEKSKAEAIKQFAQTVQSK